MNNQKKGIIFGLLSVLGGGLYAIPYRLSLDSVSALPVIWGLFLCAFLFSLPGAWLARHQTKLSWKIAGITIAISLAGVLGNYSICQALNLASPTLMVLLMRSEVIIAMILGWMFLKESVTFRIFAGVVLIITGILVMKLDSLSFEIKEWSSILWSISAAFGFASMQVLAKSIIHEIHPQVLNVFRLAIGLLLLWCVEEVRIEIPLLNISGWIWIAMAAFCGPFWGRVAFTYTLRYLTISKANIIVSFAPVMTLLFEFLFFGTLISMPEILGGVIMLASIVWVFLPGLNTHAENANN
ncbi:DMT family transporter [bacterium]|nr:DMT family transporter [bacterium]